MNSESRIFYRNDGAFSVINALAHSKLHPQDLKVLRTIHMYQHCFDLLMTKEEIIKKFNADYHDDDFGCQRLTSSEFDNAIMVLADRKIVSIVKGNVYKVCLF